MNASIFLEFRTAVFVEGLMVLLDNTFYSFCEERNLITLFTFLEFGFL